MSQQLMFKTMQFNKQTLQYGNEEISYQVFFILKQNIKIVIDVLPNGMVQVKAPENITLYDVKCAVHKRARWIHKHIKNIKKQYAYVLPRQYVSGECHFYLGRRYVLKVIMAKKKIQGVKLLRGQLQVYTESRQAENIKKLMIVWYRHRADIVFEQRLKSLFSQISWIEHTPSWKLRLMKKQWGSCSPQGILSLNPQLVKAPGECLDYVILHELCHLKEHNHSKKFYTLLHQIMPEWETVKAKLDSMSEILLSE